MSNQRARAVLLCVFLLFLLALVFGCCFWDSMVVVLGPWLVVDLSDSWRRYDRSLFQQRLDMKYMIHANRCEAGGGGLRCGRSEGAHRCASPYVRSFSFRFRRPQDHDSVRKVIACVCISKALRAFRDTVDFRGFAQLAETFLCGRARCARVIMLNSRNNNNNKNKIKNQDKHQGQEHGQEHRQSTIITTEEPASARPTS